jgi:hypothetical protein
LKAKGVRKRAPFCFARDRSAAGSFFFEELAEATVTFGIEEECEVVALEDREELNNA